MVIAQYVDGREFRSLRDGQLLTNSDAVAGEFGQWLFAEHHKEHIIVAHNFRCFDGPSIPKHSVDNQPKRVKVIEQGTQLLDLQYIRRK